MIYPVGIDSQRKDSYSQTQLMYPPRLLVDDKQRDQRQLSTPFITRQSFLLFLCCATRLRDEKIILRFSQFHFRLRVLQDSVAEWAISAERPQIVDWLSPFI